jgi:hypothetical protein
MQRVNSYRISSASKPERNVLGSYFDHLTAENAEAKVRKPQESIPVPGVVSGIPKWLMVER